MLLRFCAILHIMHQSSATYYKIIKAFSSPAIRKTYKSQQEKLIEERKGKTLKLGGDQRCESPGHSGTYNEIFFSKANFFSLEK